MKYTTSVILAFVLVVSGCAFAVSAVGLSPDAVSVSNFNFVAADNYTDGDSYQTVAQESDINAPYSDNHSDVDRDFGSDTEVRIVVSIVVAFAAVVGVVAVSRIGKKTGL